MEYGYLGRYPDKTYVGETYVAIATAYERLMKLREGSYKDNPLALENHEIELGEKLEEIPDIAISELRMKYIGAVDALDAYDPAAKDMARMQYVIAEIFYYHNKLDEARKRFERIIDRWPSMPFAAYSAGLLVNSYHKVGDVQKVYELCEYFLRFPMLGDDQELWETRLDTYEKKRRSAQFRLAEYGASGDMREGGRLFEEYYREHKGTEHDATSLYNAALWYEKAGDTVRSNQLYEEFLDDFGEDGRAPSIFFRIADQYERTMDLDRARGYYVKVARLHPDFESAGDAYYNAAFLSLGMADYGQAARYYLKYANDFEVDDAEDAYWKAAEAYRAGKMLDEALDTYQEYSRKFPDEKLDRIMESVIRRAQIYETKGNGRQEKRMKDELLQMYDSVYAAGRAGELSKDSVAFVSATAFPVLDARIAEYDEIRLPNSNDQEDLKPVLDLKQEMALSISDDALAFIARYPDFDHIMACLFIMADLYRKYADMIYAYDPPMPPGWDRNDEEMVIQFEELVEEIKIELAEPKEIKAIELFETVLTRAQEMKQNSPWVEKAREALHDADPNTYPLLKPERVQYDQADFEPRHEPLAAPIEETS